MLIHSRFRWVVCQLDYLCDCAHDEERREALKKLPPDLPESYRRLLERMNRYSSRVQTVVRLCLHFIAFASPRLTILQLQQAVSTPEILGASLDAKNSVSEREISHRCSSLIRKSENGEYSEFAHFSVQEFLENEMALSGAAGQPNLLSYSISRPRSNTLLTTQCLRFLQLRNFEQQPSKSRDYIGIMQDRDQKYPFYNYSALRWLELTKDGLDDPLVLDLSRSLFHSSKTAWYLGYGSLSLCQREEG